MYFTKRLLILVTLITFFLPEPSNVYAGPYSSGPVVACYIKNRKKPNWPGWTMLWKDSVRRSKGCRQVLAACKNMAKKWGGTDYCCTLQHGNKKIAGKNPKNGACIEWKKPQYGSGPVVACYIKNRKRPNWPGWTMLWKDSVKRSKGCGRVLPACRNMAKKWGGTDYCCTLQHGNKKITGKQPGTRACAVGKKPPVVKGPSKRKGQDQRADHRCGPRYGNAKCGWNRCCSSTGWCGGLKQPHCKSLRGYGGKFDGKRVR